MILAPLVMAAVATCSPAHTSLHFGPTVSEMTGQHTIDLAIRNDGHRACSIRGFPVLALYGKRGALPLRVYYGTDQEILTGPPQRVVLRPGGHAWVRINKYRCDLGDKRGAHQVRLVIPGSHVALEHVISRRYDMSYCGRHDPGSRLDVSPVVASRASFGGLRILPGRIVTLSVRPHGRLRDGQGVTAVVRGFFAGEKVYLSECASAADVTRFGCGKQLPQQAIGFTDSHGSATVQVRVRSRAPIGPVGSSNADVFAPCKPCVLVATDGIDAARPNRGRVAIANLHFDRSGLPFTGIPAGSLCLEALLLLGFGTGLVRLASENAGRPPSRWARRAVALVQ